MIFIDLFFSESDKPQYSDQSLYAHCQFPIHIFFVKLHVYKLILLYYFSNFQLPSSIWRDFYWSFFFRVRRTSIFWSESLWPGAKSMFVNFRHTKFWFEDVRTITQGSASGGRQFRASGLRNLKKEWGNQASLLTSISYFGLTLNIGSKSSQMADFSYNQNTAICEIYHLWGLI